MQRLTNAWAWTATVLTVLIGFIYVSLVWLATAPFDRGRYAAGRAFRHLAVVGTWLNPYWHFRTTGVKIDDPRRPYVAVSNHESYADIFLLSHLPWEMKWLAKDTIFKIPVMGWMMHMAGDIPITRGSRASVKQAIDGCRDRLSKRVSVMIFPEGTRSRTDDLLPFTGKSKGPPLHWPHLDLTARVALGRPAAATAVRVHGRAATPTTIRQTPLGRDRKPFPSFLWLACRVRQPR